jgi:hypothetical protein
MVEIDWIFFYDMPDPGTLEIMEISEHSLHAFLEEEPDHYSVRDIRNAGSSYPFLLNE